MTALLRGTLRHNTKPIHWMSSVRAMPRKHFCFFFKRGGSRWKMYPQGWGGDFEGIVALRQVAKLGSQKASSAGVG